MPQGKCPHRGPGSGPRPPPAAQTPEHEKGCGLSRNVHLTHPHLPFCAFVTKSGSTARAARPSLVLGSKAPLGASTARPRPRGAGPPVSAKQSSQPNLAPLPREPPPQAWLRPGSPLPWLRAKGSGDVGGGAVEKRAPGNRPPPRRAPPPRTHAADRAAPTPRLPVTAANGNLVGFSKAWGQHALISGRQF